MNQQEYGQKVIEMHESLKAAIKSAGGSESISDPKRLSEMTVMELLLELGPNNIRFHYEKEGGIQLLYE